MSVKRASFCSIMRCGYNIVGKYKVGDKIITKKPHACKNNEWSVERVGADIKLKCLKCGKNIFVMELEMQRMTKKIIDGNGNE